MSTVSNKFFVQIIEDGRTLHGELLATQTLTQANKDGSCIPNWQTNASSRPLIYVSLMDGATSVAIDANSDKWYYNGTLLTWSTTQTQQTIGTTTYNGYVSTNASGAFFKTQFTVDGVSMPAIGIIKNLATLSDVVDIDVVRFEGTKTLSTNPIDFQASINITITEWVSGGYMGVISFQNDKADITRDNLSVTAIGTLYDDNANPVSDVSYKWFFEGDTNPRATTKNFTITESMVYDYVMVRCEFYINIEGVSTRVASAFVGVDDKQDPDRMRIEFNGASGNSASLRSGEDVTFNMWIGKEGADAPSAAWKGSNVVYKLKTLDSEGGLVTAAFTEPTQSGTVTNIPAAGSDGYRQLPYTPSTGVAYAKVTYNNVVQLCKKGLTGIILATSSNT